MSDETERDALVELVLDHRVNRANCVCGEQVSDAAPETRAGHFADAILTSDWLADHDRKLIKSAFASVIQETVEATASRAAAVVRNSFADWDGEGQALNSAAAAILAEFKIGGEHKHPEVSNRPVTAEMATRVRLSAATVGELLEAGWTYREAINEPDTWTRPGIADLRRTDKIGGEAEPVKSPCPFDGGPHRMAPKFIPEKGLHTEHCVKCGRLASEIVGEAL